MAHPGRLFCLQKKQNQVACSNWMLTVKINPTSDKRKVIYQPRLPELILSQYMLDFAGMNLFSQCIFSPVLRASWDSIFPAGVISLVYVHIISNADRYTGSHFLYEKMFICYLLLEYCRFIAWFRNNSRMIFLTKQSPGEVSWYK